MSSKVVIVYLSLCFVQRTHRPLDVDCITEVIKLDGWFVAMDWSLELTRGNQPNDPITVTFVRMVGEIRLRTMAYRQVFNALSEFRTNKKVTERVPVTAQQLFCEINETSQEAAFAKNIISRVRDTQNPTEQLFSLGHQTRAEYSSVSYFEWTKVVPRHVENV